MQKAFSRAESIWQDENRKQQTTIRASEVISRRSGI
jgi:hypothetical protein